VSAPFENVVIVGVGLIGGSLGAAMRALPEPPRVKGIDVAARTLAVALERGAIDEALTAMEIDNALIRADLVVIATPASEAMEWLARLARLGYAGVVTDVASTKSAVTAQAGRLLAEVDATFIGGHPMAGSERSGVEASDPELFHGAYYVLCPSEDTPADAYSRLHHLVTSIGARAISIAPDAHDRAVAAISHAPHVAASALTNLAAARASDGEDVLRLAAGGFKDMTRIAAGSPELWTGICLDNSEAVMVALGDLTGQLHEFSRLLAFGDRAGLREWLSRAAQVRRALPSQWVPASARLRELTVAMSDRPGAVSAITQAAARSGCNIEDIGIDHVTEDTALLNLVLTDEGDVEELVEGLREDGFDVILSPLDAEGQA
jgi:prephenate dehydrogenase